MGASTLMRLVFGVFTFAIMARLLGPTEFGVLMFWLSIATLLSLVANYGFTPYVLREIGADRSTATTVMGEVLSAKMLVCAGIAIGSLLVLPFIAEAARAVFLLMTLAMLVDSITDFLNVGYRATNRFSSETRVATIASVCQFFIVSGSIWYRSEVMVAASAFLASRALVLLMTWVDQAQYFANLRPSPLAAALKRLKLAFSYAFDFGLQNLLGPLDSLVLDHFIGSSAVGLHQAGMRIFLGGTQIANVLGNVALPKLAAVANDATFAAIALRKKIQMAFIVSGAGFGLALSFGADFVVKVLYGSQYKELGTLLQWFGFLFFVRFLVAASGLLLTAHGSQSIRAKISLLHWTLILLSAVVLVPKNGNTGWLQALIIGNVFLAAIYAILIRKIHTPSKASVITAAAATVIFLVRLPML